jgi:hypothetical protein
LIIAARSEAGVSPVRTAAVIRAGFKPHRSANCRIWPSRLGQVLVDVGGQRLERET